MQQKTFVYVALGLVLVAVVLGLAVFSGMKSNEGAMPPPAPPITSSAPPPAPTTPQGQLARQEFTSSRFGIVFSYPDIYTVAETETRERLGASGATLFTFTPVSGDAGRSNMLEMTVHVFQNQGYSVNGIVDAIKRSGNPSAYAEPCLDQRSNCFIVIATEDAKPPIQVLLDKGSVILGIDLGDRTGQTLTLAELPESFASIAYTLRLAGGQ